MVRKDSCVYPQIDLKKTGNWIRTLCKYKKITVKDIQDCLQSLLKPKIEIKPKDDNEPHIALNNIRRRLEMMCKGTLEISSGEQGGTVVKITIPLD